MNTKTQILNGELLTEIIDNGTANEELRMQAEEAIQNSDHTALLFEIERLTKKTVQNRANLRIAAPEELKNNILNAIRGQVEAAPKSESSNEDNSISGFFKNIFSSNNK